MAVPLQYLKMNCLVVDDESTMRVTLNNMLTRMGFTSIAAAENGKKALDLIKIRPIDLVVCDVNMPEMTGVELFKTVREDRRYEHLLFVFVTAEATRQMVARAAEDGGEAYVIKPFVMATLEEKIVKVLEKKHKPNPLEMHLRNYRRYMEMKDFPKAEAELLQAAAITPDAAKITFGLGQLAHARGDVNGAIGHYKETIAKNPLFVKAYNALGELYEDIGDLPSAIAYYEKAHGISPANTERLLALTKLFYKTGEEGKAEGILKGAIADTRQDISTSAHLMGVMYLSKGENEKALEMLIKAHKMNPSDISLLQSLAEAYRKVGRPEEALETYARILEVAPGNADVHYSIGKTYLEMGVKDKAIRAIKNAWALNPFSKEITVDLKALAQQDKLGL
ncbi:MAG: response regulator [Alphaproteobacteria bacterium]|uniref:Response regulator n=1 Tax=Candidatus Nitrobium versatile TaxID=2884831 RepID=A0A953M2W1_9BACT|nr:response regulator [Candidatus Nitrobium versatile]